MNEKHLNGETLVIFQKKEENSVLSRDKKKKTIFEKETIKEVKEKRKNVYGNSAPSVLKY